MIIDGFTLFGSWPGLPYEHSAEELISGLERFKIDRACTISSQSIFFHADDGNRTTQQVCENSTRLVAIGAADPRVDGIAQLEYCREHKFRMMALFPNTQQWSLDNITIKPLLKAISEAGMPLIIEAKNDGDVSRIFNLVADLPLPVIFHEVSLQTLSEAIAVLRSRPDTYLGTRLLCGADTIEILVDEFGADRLIFTSRYPISCFSSAFLTATYAKIDDAARQAIMGGNIARLIASA